MLRRNLLKKVEKTKNTDFGGNLDKGYITDTANWYLKEPETIDQLISMLELEFPHKIDVQAQWEDYYSAEQTAIPTVKKIDPNKHVIQGSDKEVMTDYLLVDWLGDDEKDREKVIKGIYRKIKKDMIKNNKTSVSWRMKPNIEVFIDFETRKITNSFYARTIYV